MFKTFIINPNINKNNLNDINGNALTDIKPSFPPALTINDLIKNALKSSINNKPRTIPNAFIVYRMALINEYYIKSCKLPPMGEFSKIAKKSWNKEPKYVKDFYNSLVKDAKSIYKQNKIQIVLDKHMEDNKNHVENNQKSGQLQSTCVAYDAEWNNTRVFPVEDVTFTENSSRPVQNFVVDAENSSCGNDVSFSGIDFVETNYIPNDQEYIRILEQENRMLEQVIDCLLRN